MVCGSHTAHLHYVCRPVAYMHQVMHSYAICLSFYPFKSFLSRWWFEWIGRWWIVCMTSYLSSFTSTGQLLPRTRSCIHAISVYLSIPFKSFYSRWWFEWIEKNSKGLADGLMHRQHSVPFSDRAAAIERELQGVLSPVFPLCDCPQNALVLKRTVIRILLKIQAQSLFLCDASFLTYSLLLASMILRKKYSSSG